MMHEWACCRDEASNYRLPIAEALWIIWIVSMEECSSLTQYLMQIHCSICSVILNVMATQYTCSLNIVYHPHWLVQWSCSSSYMYIPVYHPWLPYYINVTQTVLIILTMAGLSPDRPHISVFANGKSSAVNIKMLHSSLLFYFQCIIGSSN